MTDEQIKLRYQQLTQLPGIIYREQPGRKTFAADINGQPCFVKLHGGVGWREIIKNLIQGRLPIIGATTEYLALTALAKRGIPSLQVVEYGAFGLNPATQQSYLITKALQNTISLEDFCRDWAKNPPSVRLKRSLIRALAELVASMHLAGINHRDCYLCHFHLDLTALATGAIKLTLIDLHRAQIRKKVPIRWQVKDIAGLYFSAMGLGFSWRDYLWFVKHYAVPLAQRYQFYQQVEQRAYALWLKTRYHCKKYFASYQLSVKDNSALPDSINACDALIKGGEIIKDDATTTVAKVVLSDDTVVMIKRYNVRSFAKGIKRLCRTSRARKSWDAGIRLRELGFLTPEPLALFEQRFGCFRGESYLICAFVAGEDLGHHFAHYPAFLQVVIYQQLLRILSLMKLLRMSHGDMKATNFLWHPAGIYLLDLDASRSWSNPAAHLCALTKDARRLAKNKLI